MRPSKADTEHFLKRELDDFAKQKGTTVVSAQKTFNKNRAKKVKTKDVKIKKKQN